MEPITRSTTLNEELKNPHLIETVVRVLPSTGKRIESANLAELPQIFTNKMTGEIPQIDVNFNIQGIPLILSRQSYVELRLTPHFAQELQIRRSYLPTPLTFEYNRALWPKVNAACVANASATFSNFGIENQNPLFLPYIRSFQMNEDLRVNHSRTWNPSYLSTTSGDRLTYANRFVSMTGNGSFSAPDHRSPYEVTAIKDPGKDFTYAWYGQPLLVQIPLEDILPVFQIPVIPLRQTNTSNINIRLQLRSPRHMFYSSGYLNPTQACVFQVLGELPVEEPAPQNLRVVVQEGGQMILDPQDDPPANADEIVAADEEAAGFQAFTTGYLASGAEGDLQVPLENAVIGGGTLAWLQLITTSPFATVPNIASFSMDFDVDCELVLRAITNPLLNPLAQNYIEPFLDEQNQFVAHFTDYFSYSQSLVCNLLTNTRFSFTPSQLFYNTTHLVLFLMQDPPAKTPTPPTQLSGLVDAGSIKSLFQHGHFVMREYIDIKQFQISLGSSCVPLFDRPLDMVDMAAVTEESMKKYNPNEMYGDVMFIQNRFQEGDSFFFFDLTHARNSGFFIDADNMIRVDGVITARKPLSQKALAEQNANPDQAAGGVVNRVARIDPAIDPIATQATIHLILLLMWQNTFTVLLDLDGAVLFQQQ